MLSFQERPREPLLHCESGEFDDRTVLRAVAEVFSLQQRVLHPRVHLHRPERDDEQERDNTVFPEHPPPSARRVDTGNQILRRHLLL